MSKKNVAIIIILIIALGSLGYFYIQLQTNFEQLSTSHTLSQETFVLIVNKYDALNMSHTSLQEDCASLTVQHSSLIEQNYTQYDSGYADGEDVGYSGGYDSGYAYGEDVGYSGGYDSGYAYGEDVGYSKGYSSGYGDGFDVGYAQGLDDSDGTGEALRDPTYAEMLEFIAWDTTDSNEYTSSYQCEEFSLDMKLNAIAYGYNCEMFYIKFTVSAHAIVFFDTTDRGRVYVEPQTDDVVILLIGESYSAINGFIPHQGDIIEWFDVLWW